MWWKKALICRSSKLDVCSGSPQNWNFTLYYKTLDIFEALPYRTKRSSFKYKNLISKDCLFASARLFKLCESRALPGGSGVDCVCDTEEKHKTQLHCVLFRN